MRDVSGRDDTVFPIHLLTEKLEPSVVDVLPAVHAHAHVQVYYNLIVLCYLRMSSVFSFQCLGDFRRFCTQKESDFQKFRLKH